MAARAAHVRSWLGQDDVVRVAVEHTGADGVRATVACWDSKLVLNLESYVWCQHRESTNVFQTQLSGQDTASGLLELLFS